MLNRGLEKSRGLRAAIALTIILGCIIRFYDLGAKVYWEDETFTSLRVAGYTRQELVEANFSGQVIYPEDLQNFQTINADKSALDTVASLADDVHPPGYFLLLRVWAQCFGSSATAMRMLSTLLSLLLFPSVYWLCVTLFERGAVESKAERDVGWLAIALISISPFHLLAATEARMYSLWAVLTTLLGVFLWRSLHRHSRLNWILYTLIGIASLYVHWFTVLVLLSHGLYFLIIRGLRWTRDHTAYLLSLSAIGTAILPWVVFVGQRLTYVYSQTTWTAVDVSLVGESSLTHRWLSVVTQIFFATGALLPEVRLFQIFLSFLVVAIIVGSLLFLVSQTQKAAWSFILISSGLMFGLLATGDLILGGQRSTIFRYFIPAFIAIEIAVAFALINGQRTIAKAVCNGLIMVLLIGGGLSQIVDKASFTPVEQPLVRVAKVLNETPSSRLVSDTRPSLLLPLANLLTPDNEMQFTVRPQRPDLSDTANRAVFLYQASEGLQAALEEQGYFINPVLGVEDMFRLSPEN